MSEREDQIVKCFFWKILTELATSVFYSIIRNLTIWNQRGVAFLPCKLCIFTEQKNMGLFITTLHIGWMLGKPLVNLESTG